MARERRLPSARSSVASTDKQATYAAETQDHKTQPTAQAEEKPDKAVLSAGDETNKQDEHQQSSSSEVEDTRTFQQLVHDYGDDMLSLNELFHAQPSSSDVEAKIETGDGK